MNKYVLRSTLSLVSMSLGLLVVYLIAPRKSEFTAAPLVDNRENIRALLEQRTSAEPNGDVAEGPLVREFIPENIAKQLFGAIRGDRVVYDPQCYFWEIPNYSGSVPFPEHATGTWPIRTNNKGFRKNVDVLRKAPDLRILITGDSHTAGRVPNGEQFGNVLEKQLEQLAPGFTVESLNGGKGAYSFYNYLGVLEKWLHLKPDVFIMAVYGGNDFAAPVTLYRYFNKLDAGVGADPETELEWKAVVGDYKSLVTQDMNQVLAFSHRPEDIPMAESLARQATRAMRDLCEENGIRFLVVYIPPCSQVQPHLVQDQMDDLCERMGVSEGDIAGAKQVEKNYIDFLGAEKIATINMAPVYAAQEEACYWSSDLHINTLGHRLLADRLTEELSWLLRKGQ